LALFAPIGAMSQLRYLFLQSLRQVTELPDFGGTPALKRLHIETMKGVSQFLSPSVAARALEELVIADIATPGSRRPVRSLVGHPRLQAATLDLGSRKKSEAATALLGLQPVDEFKARWREV
jgi:hypothetical protein